MVAQPCGLFLYGLFFLSTLAQGRPMYHRAVVRRRASSGDFWSVSAFGAHGQVRTQYFHLEFMAGCLLAVYAQRRNASGGVLWIALGAILFVLGWITFGVLFVGVGVRTPLYTLASCALITGALAVEKHRDIRLPPIVDLLGAASYSMLVINPPVIVAATKILAYTGVLSAVHFGLTIPFIFLLVIAASIFVHVSIERPLIALFTAFFDQLSLMLGRIDLRKPKDSI